MIGTRVGPYVVLDKLGSGGMGEVYLANDERLHRQVAVKILPARFAGDAERVRRFEQEARTVSALNHPHIVTLFDLGRDGEAYYMATEFVDGRTLRDHLAGSGRLPTAEAIAVVLQCARALACAHAAGVVHRDVKPENVMVRRDGYVKVLDFGIAKLMEPQTSADATTAMADRATSIGAVLGTTGYLSPEQARGEPVDCRTDVFSLGVVLHEVLTGVHPFTGRTPSDTLAAILRSDPPPLSATLTNPDPGLQEVLRRALAKDRSERYASLDNFIGDLEAIARSAPLNTHDSTPHAARPAAHRRTVVGAASVTLVCVVLLAAAYGVWWSVRPSNGAASNTAGEVRGISTLAVLPFRLIGYAPAGEHLGLGMADALIVKLTKLHQLTVRPTTAVSHYQQDQGDVAAIGRALQVEAVLVGNLQRSAGRTRVTVQLIRTGADGAGAAVWSDEFTTTSEDPFEIQDRLTARLIDGLAMQVSGREQATIRKRETESARAHQLYMEGRFFMNKLDAAGVTRALELFGDAAREDPQYAQAHYGRALALTRLISEGVRTEAEALPAIRDALDRAIALDPELAEAYGLRSLIARGYDWRFDQAARDSDRSIDLEPNNPSVLQWRGVHLLAVGRGDEAVNVHQRAVDIDPLDLTVRTQLCRALYLTKRYEQAIQTGRAVLLLDTNQSAAHQWVGLSLSATGQHDAAIASLKTAVELAPKNTERIASLAYAYGVAGRAVEARKLLAALHASGPGLGYSFHVATVYVGLGERERAREWLQRAWQERDGFLANRLQIDPRMDALRNVVGPIAARQ